MAVTALWYGNAFVTTFTKKSNWASDAAKCSLHTSTYSVDQDADDFWNDATNEVTSTNYTTGGVSVGSGLTATYTGGTNVYALDGSDATWTTVTFTMRYGVVYNSTPGTSATDPLLMYVNAGADQTVSAANFSIVWDSAGICKVTVS